MEEGSSGLPSGSKCYGSAARREERIPVCKQVVVVAAIADVVVIAEVVVAEPSREPSSTRALLLGARRLADAASLEHSRRRSLLSL